MVRRRLPQRLILNMSRSREDREFQVLNLPINGSGAWSFYYSTLQVSLMPASAAIFTSAGVEGLYETNSLPVQRGNPKALINGAS